MITISAGLKWQLRRYSHEYCLRSHRSVLGDCLIPSTGIPIEVMAELGYIALMSGIAGGAELL